MLSKFIKWIASKLMLKDDITELYIENVVYANHRTALVELFANVKGMTDDIGKRIPSFDYFAMDRLTYKYTVADLAKLMVIHAIVLCFNKDDNYIQVRQFFRDLQHIRSQNSNVLKIRKGILELVHERLFFDAESSSIVADVLIHTNVINIENVIQHLKVNKQ